MTDRCDAIAAAVPDWDAPPSPEHLAGAVIVCGVEIRARSRLYRDKSIIRIYFIVQIDLRNVNVKPIFSFCDSRGRAHAALLPPSMGVALRIGARRRLPVCAVIKN